MKRREKEPHINVEATTRPTFGTIAIPWRSIAETTCILPVKNNRTMVMKGSIKAATDNNIVDKAPLMSGHILCQLAKRWQQDETLRDGLTTGWSSGE
ncbi:MAG: hypothetical protein SWE60_01220 [Thermodesulfobacteriota bacterium]|nr:hypothetical protein [Thermodesulfobacteriota bacterium]